jgi:hypothetical protein
VEDANGAPVSGGFVHTYVPGGTTPKATWQDAAETIPNANPVPLDSAGSALIYGSGAYQLTVVDANGVAVPGYSGVTTDLSGAVVTETARALAAEAANTAAIALRALSSGFASALSLIGYQKLPSGLILQWGTANTVAGGGVSAGFAINFPTLALNFSASVAGALGPNPYSVSVGAPSVSGGNIWVSNASGVGVAGVALFWTAIGA